MPDYVRVRDKETGHHYTVTQARLDTNPDLWQELKQPATDSAGTPLPPKYKTTVAKQVTENKAAKATSEREN